MTSSARYQIRHSKTKEVVEEGSLSISNEPGKRVDDSGDCIDCSKSRNAGFLRRLARGVPGLLKSELGIGMAPDEVIQRRKELCLACEHHDFGVCNECGCYLKAKTAIASEACPLNKWVAVTTKSSND